MQNTSYAQFRESANYILFKSIIDNEISEYVEKIKNSNEKEAAWQFKKAINTLETLLITINDKATEKEESPSE